MHQPNENGNHQTLYLHIFMINNLSIHQILGDLMGLQANRLIHFRMNGFCTENTPYLLVCSVQWALYILIFAISYFPCTIYSITLNHILCGWTGTRCIRQFASLYIVEFTGWDACICVRVCVYCAQSMIPTVSCVFACAHIGAYVCMHPMRSNR